MSPDGSSKLSPEERLLRLIRGKSKAAASGAESASAPVGAPTATRPGAGMAAVATRMPSWRWPQVATVGLGVILGLEAIVLIVQLLRPVPTLELPVSAPAAQEPFAPPEIPSLARSVSRPLFVTSIEPGSSDASSRQAPSQSAKQLASRLSLLGIVAGERPQAIIEDAETKRTYFVTRGQPVVEGAVVEEVLENRVILDLQGEQVEIAL